jgi:hypothetical protein
MNKHFADDKDFASILWTSCIQKALLSRFESYTEWTERYLPKTLPLFTTSLGDVRKYLANVKEKPRDFGGYLHH